LEQNELGLYNNNLISIILYNMTSRRQARCDNRLALTFEARANIPRMRSRLAKWRPETILVLARF